MSRVETENGPLAKEVSLGVSMVAMHHDNALT